MIEIKEINLGNAIQEVMVQKGKTIKWVADEIDVDASALNRLLKKNDFSTRRLVQVSKALDFNFFGLYAPTLMMEDELKKTQQRVKEQDGQIAEKDRRISELEKENKMMKDFLEVLKKR